MPLVKSKLTKSLDTKFLAIFKDQIASMQETDTPSDVIKNLSKNLATAVSDAVDEYIRSGDVVVSSQNIEVIIPTGKSAVVPLRPAKII